MVMNKINILLVDDNPRFFRSNDDIPDVKLSTKYREHFYLHWIKTYKEARFVLHCFQEICKHAPQDTLSLGLPPELLIFDYDLSAPDGDKEKSPHQSSNLSEKIQNYLKASTINVSTPIITEVEERSDKSGVFVGIHLNNAFQSYPCGAIPTTAHVKTSGTDAEALESLNDRNFDGAFAYKNRLAPTWEQLINFGVNKLRNKIIDLISSGLIRIPSDELFYLVKEPEKSKTEYLSIYSRFGLRKIPIAGLFIDVIEDLVLSQL